MHQEIEIEYKNIVTREEFERVTTSFHIPSEAFISQTNYYFDTPTFSLKELGCALRIRYKNGKYTLTLKQPHGDGLLETHQQLSKVLAEELISGKTQIIGEMKEHITSMGISSSELSCFGSLRTNRAETTYKSGVLVFDHSEYLNCQDYEIEYEVSNPKEGELAFKELLESFNIPTRQTKNKIQRFYDKSKGND